MFVIRAYAEPAGGGRGTTVRDASQARRGNESMGQYYNRTGQSALGGNVRTRGRLTNIRPARG